MADALDIFDLVDVQLFKQRVKVHFVHDALDVGHADLKRMVVVFVVSIGVETLPQLRRYQAFPVKLQHLHIHGLLHTGIGADRFYAAVILHSDHRDVLHDAPGIVHHDDVIGIHVEGVPVDLLSACEHQTVVGVELRELALSDLHAQAHALPHGIIEIGADKGELIIPAHAGRTLEGHETDGSSVKDELDPLRAKEKLSHLLQLLHPPDRPPVEDPGEVEINQEALQLFLIREPRLAGNICQRQKLTEHGAVILHCLCDRALIGLVVGVEIKAPAVLRLLREIQDRPRGDLKDAVLLQFHRHSLPSGWFPF